LALLGGAAQASGPLGVIAVIDKVVTEPSGTAPERVLIFGTFVLARGERAATYDLPRYGLLYYKTVPGEEEQAHRDWATMQKKAGTGQVLGWADTDLARNLGRLLPVKGDKGEPDPYPPASGVQQFRADSTFPPAQALRNTPAVVAPADGDEVASGAVELIAHNLPGDRPGVSYLFFIESGTGETESSPALRPGKEQTSWKPRMEIKAGQKYTWRAWCRIGTTEDKGRVSTATFRGK
jgi:hypothetical protein